MSGTEQALMAMLALLALVCLGGVVAPRPYCALLKQWYEFWGANYDALIKSERRSLMAMRVASGVALVAVLGLAALVIYVCSAAGQIGQ